jgi:hypothetical protein
MPEESSADKKLCIISKDLEGDFNKAFVRADVCYHLPADYQDDEDNHYCILHFPNDNKHNNTNFESVVKDKLERNQYFQYVYFPGGGVFQGRTFKHDVNFNHAVFSSDAYFGKAEFNGRATFIHTTFKEKADFSGAKFSQQVEFKSTKFSHDANFDRTKFLTEASFSDATFSDFVYFSSATFAADAYFSRATFAAGANFNSAKFSDFVYFSSATFSAAVGFTLAKFSSGAYFESTIFSAAVDFNSAKFLADAYFSSATIMAEVNFKKTKFGKDGSTNFDKTNFAGDTFFDRTKFGNDLSFNSAIFGSESYVIFRRAFFARTVDFRYCCAEGYLIFSNPRQSKKSSFELQHAVFEQASRISFHTVHLRPSWFVNIDSRKFVLTDIFWINRDWDFWNRNIDRELQSLEERGIKDQKKRLFEIAARQLAVNAEENNRYEEAAKFRYMAMEIRRLEDRRKLDATRYLMWLYKWTSGYGESWHWAVLVLLVLILFFGLLYASPLSAFDYGGENQHWMYKIEGLVHSLYVAAFQRPEPKAADNLTKIFILLETIFAPLQAALLALAIRRKFMR